MSTTTLTSHRFRSFLADDSLSLRSFRAKSQSPTPSLKASSLKQTAPLAKILNPSGRGPAHTTYHPTIKDLSRPSFDDKELTLAIGLPPLLPEMPSISKGSDVLTPTSVARDDSQPSRSKPKTIIRMLTTKFSSRSSSGSPARSTPPPAPQTASAKEKRDAALRARGLLPPLPLSVQEAAQDRQIPVVSSPTTANAPASSSSTSLSEADRIKSEWEAQNKSTEVLQRERMASFKFGGNASSTSLNSPPSPTGPSEHTKPDSPLLKSSLDLPQTTTALSPPPSPRGRLSDHNDPYSLPQRSRPTAPEVEAYMIPLPASPSSSKLPVDTSSVISSIEPSSSTEKLDYTDSLTSTSDRAEENVSDSGVCTPQPQPPTVGDAVQALLELGSSSAMSPPLVSSTETTPTPTSPTSEIKQTISLQNLVPTTPTISLTPPATPSEPLGYFKSSISPDVTGEAGARRPPSPSSNSGPPSPSHPDPPSFGTAFPGSPESILRSDSIEASILAPSLSSDSGISVSTTSSYAILGASGKGTASTKPGFEKLDGLTLNTSEGGSIPGIVESPVIGAEDWLGRKFSSDGLDVVVEEPESLLGSPLASAGTPKSKLSLAVDVVGVKEDENGNYEEGDLKVNAHSSTLRTSSPEPLSPLSPISPTSPLRSPTAGTFAAQQGQKRHVTDPVDRRKSVFRAFKRSTTRDASRERENSEPPTSPISKSRSGMFSSVRKSVVGSIGGGLRRNGTVGQRKVDEHGKIFDASALPVSPTSPSRFAFSPSASAARERSTSRDRVSSTTSRDTGGAPRQAVSPQMYNQGSILIEASAIEDEETRRMTELAFLG